MCQGGLDRLLDLALRVHAHHLEELADAEVEGFLVHAASPWVASVVEDAAREGLAALLALPGATLAQAFPTRVVRVVVPFAPGGPVDALARMLSGRLTSAWGQQILVDNRSGGNTVIGTEIVARATADRKSVV